VVSIESGPTKIDDRHPVVAEALVDFELGCLVAADGLDESVGNAVAWGAVGGFDGCEGGSAEGVGLAIDEENLWVVVDSASGNRGYIASTVCGRLSLGGVELGWGVGDLMLVYSDIGARSGVRDSTGEVRDNRGSLGRWREDVFDSPAD